MNDAYISEDSNRKNRDVEVTGVDFYETISSLPVLRSFYTAARKKWFDVYDVGTAIVFYGITILKKAHNGVLPMYLTWVLAGLIIVIFVLSTVSG